MTKLYYANNLNFELNKGVKALGLELDANQCEKLLNYVTLMVKWNHVYNLTAFHDPFKIVTYHLLDSLATVWAFVKAKRVLDVGTGGGFPGIVLAIWAAKANPMMHISLIDTVHKKTAFLTQVKAQLQLNNILIYTTHVEQLYVNKLYDVITSRAFGKLKDLIILSSHLLQSDGYYIVFKGSNLKTEIMNLPDGWCVTNIQILKVPSLNTKRSLVFLKKLI